MHRGITNSTVIREVIALTGNSQIEEILSIPEIAKHGSNVYNEIVVAGQTAFASAYRYVYLVSIGKCTTNRRLDKIGTDGPQTVFGVISVIAAAFLGDISKYMDDHVAVVIE